MIEQTDFMLIYIKRVILFLQVLDKEFDNPIGAGGRKRARLCWLW